MQFYIGSVYCTALEQWASAELCGVICSRDKAAIPFDIGRSVFIGGGEGKGTGFPNTMSPRPRPTSVPSGILIHPAVWPQQPVWAS